MTILKAAFNPKHILTPILYGAIGRYLKPENADRAQESAIAYHIVNAMVKTVFPLACFAVTGGTFPINDDELEKKFDDKYPTASICLTITGIALPIFLAKRYVNSRAHFQPLTYKDIVKLAVLSKIAEGFFYVLKPN